MGWSLIFLATVVAVQAVPRDARPSGPTATISGCVTERESGRPLPRILVTAEGAPSVRLETLTDSDGRYQLTNIPSGEYTLSAAPEPHRSTYLPMRHGDDRPVMYLATSSRANLELKAGESRANVDFALWRALAIEGRVLDPWEQPMANVDVSVRRSDGQRVAVRDATTNDVGRYRIYGLPPGGYRVCAQPQRDANVTEAGGLRLVSTCHMSALSPSEGSDVVLQSSDASGIDIRVQRVGSFTIAGTIVDAAGTRVSRAWVTAGRWVSESHESSSSTTDTAGQFLLKGLIPGRYLLRASVGGANPGDPNPPSREREAGYATVDVDADTSVGTISLSKPATVSGIVSFDGNPAPSPQQLRLLVYPRPMDEGWARMEMHQPQGAVDDRLRFELKGLYRLPHVIVITNIPENWALQRITYQGRDITYHPTDFGEANSDSPVRVVLTNRVARPSVRVNENAPFHVLILRANAAIRRFATKVVSGNEARNGVLSLGALVPGDYLIAAVAAEAAFEVFDNPARLDAVAAVATRLTVRANEEPTLELSVVAVPPKR